MMESPENLPPAWQRSRHFGRHFGRRWRSRFGERAFGGPPPDWHGKRRVLFFRFLRIILAALLLFLASLAGLAYLFTRLSGGSGQVTALTWLVSCGLAFAFPTLVGLFAMRTFFRYVNPLARVMAAADSVAEGDLSVRVPVEGPGEFRKLADSFNRMVAELQRSDQLRRDLTADVAHELRTPLHIIQGNLEGVQDGVYPADAAQIELLLDETRQLSRLVDDLRTLSLAEAGQLSLKKEPVDVHELLSDVATSFSGQAEAAKVDLRVEESPQTSPLAVQADPGRLDQVLSNLIANALHHTPPGGVITLQAQATEQGVRFKVSDTGNGIPAEDLPFIFDRFWRGERFPDGSQGLSSGLGLPIARRLVEANGGRISVESQPGQGTTFTIELPQ